MACTSREVESRIALLIAHAKIGPRGEQVFRDLQMALSRRAHQRRSAAAAARPLLRAVRLPHDEIVHMSQTIVHMNIFRA